VLQFGSKGYLENKAWSIYAIFISIVQSEKKHGEGTAGMEREKAFFLGRHVCGCFRYALHNVKSDLIWRKYSPCWLYKAIAINGETSGGLEILAGVS